MTPDLVSEHSWRLLAHALAGCGVSVLLLDRTQAGPRVVSASEGFERLTGYPAEEAVGQSLHFLEGPETDRSASEELARTLLEAREGRVVLRHYRKDGSSF